ncbi:MAG: DNA repair protein RecN [Actinomycetota bacterium]
MLTDLRIKNFALIDEAHIKFEAGLNIMTGETGAGKTIVLEAMNLLLGKRADPVLIGAAGDEAEVEALINVNGKETVLARSVTAAGKNKCFINRQLANVGMLAEIADGLVDFHGQHEHQALLKVSTHLNYLDGFGGEELLGVRANYEEAYAEFSGIEDELNAISAAERSRLSQLDLMRFQVEEIERTAPELGEDETLEKELLIQRSAGTLAKAVSGAIEALRGEDETAGGVDALNTAAREIQPVAQIEENLKNQAEKLESLAIEADEIARDLYGYRAGIQYDAARLNEAEARLEYIKILKKKYGDTIEAVLKYKDKAKAELEKIEDSSARMDELNARRRELEASLYALSEDMTAKRRQAAGVLEKRVEAELAELNLKGCRFKVGFGETLDLTPAGKDRIEFLLSPNVGQGLKPLAKVASGGEVSRIMLALKIAFIQADPVPILIFDEIDSGIGGETAAAVGAKLKQLSANHQVICITHLPQIAAYGGTHLFVSKSVRDGATYTSVKVLSEEGRVNELARMLTGGEATAETSKQHARELLTAARAKTARQESE